MLPDGAGRQRSISQATHTLRVLGRDVRTRIDDIEAAREAARLSPEDERLREEELQLLALRTRIEERLSTLAA